MVSTRDVHFGRYYARAGRSEDSEEGCGIYERLGSTSVASALYDGVARCLCEQDKELRQRKLDCERNDCGHLGMEHERLHCAYRCASNVCFEEVYSHDPVCCATLRRAVVSPTRISLAAQLEEGEIDTNRNRQYMTCYRREYRAKTTS